MNPDENKVCDEFYTATEEKLGPEASSKYFESDPDIVAPNLDRYGDDEEHQTHITEVVDITP